jgi:hypothetical protein
LLKRISSGDFSLFLSFHGRKRKENKTKVILDNVICSFCPALRDLRYAPTCTKETNQRKYSQNSLPRHFGDHSQRTRPTLPGLPSPKRLRAGRRFGAQTHITMHQKYREQVNLKNESA